MKAHNLNQTEVWDTIAGALDMNKTQIAAKAGIQASVFAQLKIRVKKGVDTYLGSDTLARVLSAFPQINANFIFGTSPDVLVRTGAGLTGTAHGAQPGHGRAASHHRGAGQADRRTGGGRKAA